LLERFQKLQSQILRKILDVFKTSSISAMKIEASLPSPKIRFNKICKNYALRILQMHKKYLIRLRVSFSFPSFTNGIELDWTQFKDWNETENEAIYTQASTETELLSESTRRRKRRKVSKKSRFLSCLE